MNDLEQLAQRKRLPLDFLQSLGVEAHPEGGVIIRYYDGGGTCTLTRYRDRPGRPRFDQPKGVGLVAYGEWRLEEAIRVGVLHITEGESNPWALWFNGFPALGVPGNNAYNVLIAEHLDSISKVYVHYTDDDAGRAFLEKVPARLREIGYKGEVYDLRMPEGVKDVGDLHANDPDKFAVAFRECVQAARNIDAEQVATIHDLIRAGSEVKWLWQGWLQTGVVNAIAGKGGCGKTRFCADLLRRIVHDGHWPDGARIELSQESLVLWVVADNHHDEMVTLARDFGLMDSIRINSTPADPYGGVTLENEEDYTALERRIAAVKPVFVVIDTVGNATDKSLSRQEDAKAFYQPLQLIARRQRTCIICLTHLNAGGQFLGRRVLEKVRVAIKIDQFDGEERRRLEVLKTNSKKPDALGMTMTGNGNEYDNKPPEAPEEFGDQPRGTPPKVKEAAEWLESHLSKGPDKVVRLREHAEAEGISARSLYRAKELLGLSEYESQSLKWWSLMDSGESL